MGYERKNARKDKRPSAFPPGRYLALGPTINNEKERILTKSGPQGSENPKSTRGKITPPATFSTYFGLNDFVINELERCCSISFVTILRNFKSLWYDSCKNIPVSEISGWFEERLRNFQAFPSLHCFLCCCCTNAMV